MRLISDDDIDWAMYEQETEAKQQVKSAKVYVQQVIDRARSGVREVQHYMPWGKTHRLIQFRPGEVTFWAGENDSGKSLVTGQVVLSLCAQDQRCAVASFEMKPEKTMRRMGRQWTKFRPDDPEILSNSYEFDRVMDLYEQFRDWTDERLWLYDRQGTVHWKQICAVARYCAKELKINHFVIDNLAKCVRSEEDLDGQKAFVDEVCAIARDHNIHIHVVHHVKKPSDGKKPDRYSMRGSGAISDQPDNVILVWRDKGKEKDRQAKKMISETQPDTLLIVDKQRNGEGWEGMIGLWFHHQSNQFLGGHNVKPMDFYTAPVEEESHD